MIWALNAFIRSLESPVKAYVVSLAEEGTHYHAFYSAIVNAVNYLLSRASQKYGLHAYSFSVGLSAARLKHLCAAPVTNCRKNDLTSWFAGIGGYSVLRTDVNAVHIRQEGVPPFLPFTFHPA